MAALASCAGESASGIMQGLELAMLGQAADDPRDDIAVVVVRANGGRA
jgi:hypothetical protein